MDISKQIEYWKSGAINDIDTGEVPPKSHNLIWLLNKTSLNLKTETIDFLGVLMDYQIEGRYPNYNPEIPSLKIINEYLSKTKELLTCLNNKL